MDNEFFLGDPNDGKNIYTWLGCRTIHNKARDIEEKIETYLLRHTRLLPRDIVILGNILCAEIQKSKTIPNYDPPEDFIRKAVGEAARIFGNEQISICANQIISGFIPKHAAIQGYSESYVGNQEYTRGVADDLKRLLRTIKTDRFTFEDMNAAKELIAKMWENNAPDPFSILWQNGLLGYTEQLREGEKEVFFSENMLDDFHVPLEKGGYVLHSCLIDSVGLQSIGSRPVVTF